MKLKNNKNKEYFIVTNQGIKYPDKIHPFKHFNHEFFVAESFGHFDDSADIFQNNLYCVTEKQTGRRLGNDYDNISEAKFNAIIHLEKVGYHAFKNALAKAIERNAKLNLPTV